MNIEYAKKNGGHTFERRRRIARRRNDDDGSDERLWAWESYAAGTCGHRKLRLLRVFWWRGLSASYIDVSFATIPDV